MNIVPEFEFKSQLAKMGYTLPNGMIIKNGRDYSGRYPVVAKVNSDKITHKTEAGAIIVDIKGQEELISSISLLNQKFPGEEIYVEEMARRGIEVIIGLLKDEKFGKLILLGLGGFYSELLRDVTFKKLPITRNDAEAMIGELRYSRIFNGYRNLTTNKKMIADLLVRLSDDFNNKEFQQIDFNPIFLYADSYLIVDAKMIV
ncbi:MAG: acetate--CoA ligase family protein [Candidatus Thermoplasmatota archaeon]|jgi:succinyl-CoA synthetase beta subunit|nr:acetate--CoA ligase family protein [Candidatus Thermoplasmatota archaeon]MCL5681413.1 acetate--CoA ligase family protein [Candidatus Thermoplasmatota archaeon]